tara:strand:- start:797 stop:1756 length:960 start_codon:yes stop_codon:yes gene_type:complete
MKQIRIEEFLPIFGKDICIVTPTFKRTQQLDRLLKTLTKQTLAVGSIIVADGMGDAEETVANYQNQLPVKWLNCPVKGQISQRNYALKKLQSNVKIVIYFDDDMQLENNAILEMVNFWNKQTSLPAGVGFNNISVPERPDNIFRNLFCLATEPYGKVWRSGYNSPCSNPKESMTSEWLSGGSTAWRRDILDAYPVLDIPSKWAICEDLIFSYPVGKIEPLYQCDKAKVKEINDNVSLGFTSCVERSMNTVLWRLYFVSKNPELSILLFYWMNIGLLVGYIVRSLKGNRLQFGNLVGTFLGVSYSLIAMLLGKKIRNLLK